MQGCETQQKTRCHPRAHPKSDQSPQHQHLATCQFSCCWEWALRHPLCKASDRALRMPCVPTLRQVLPLTCPTMGTQQCRLGQSASSSGWFSGTTLMNLSARACAELGDSGLTSSATGVPWDTRNVWEQALHGSAVPSQQYAPYLEQNTILNQVAHLPKSQKMLRSVARVPRKTLDRWVCPAPVKTPPQEN